MKKLVRKVRVEAVLELLPRCQREEILRLASGRREGLLGIREIEIRRCGVCSLKLGRENIHLTSRVDEADMAEMIERLTGGALYAHRDSIAEGFISLPGGIRVGVCGSAAYDGEKLVGISNMSSLLFRIPTGECAFEDELYAVFCEGIGRGMIIYSPPGVGKTTAIRRLAYMIGGENSPKRVAVVDERGEFDENDYFDRRVDILRGYKKGIGIEIATRTMSPDLIMIDEIGADDVEPMLSAIKCGVPIIATAHAADKDELLSRPALRRLFDYSAFDKLVGIRVENGKYILSVDSL